MLQQVCEHIHNYFIPKDNNYPRCWADTYTIHSGAVSPAPPLKEGQRFWIVGSDLNDGVYTYHASGLTDDDDSAAAGLQDEVFTGTIAAMAVPPAVIALTEEINDWVAKYGAVTASPYSSETVNGVYTYVKAVKSEAAGGGGYSWQDVFKARLSPYRRICL